MSKEAMKLACKALRDCHYYMINAGLPNQSLLNEAFTAYMELEAALAKQPAQQEPVAWMTKDGEIYKHDCWPEHEARPLVFGDTSPQPAQRTWVGLTANEVEEIFQKKLGYYPTIYAVEAKLKERNQ